MVCASTHALSQRNIGHLLGQFLGFCEPKFWKAFRIRSERSEDPCCFSTTGQQLAEIPGKAEGYLWKLCHRRFAIMIRVQLFFNSLMIKGLRFAPNVLTLVFVFVTAPLVDSIPRHSSSAMLMLLSVVFLGLAVFLIYKFKRYIYANRFCITYSFFLLFFTRTRATELHSFHAHHSSRFCLSLYKDEI